MVQNPGVCTVRGLPPTMSPPAQFSLRPLRSSEKTTTLNLLTKLIGCFMNIEVQMCVRIYSHFLSFFYTKGGMLHSLFCSFRKVLRRAVLSLWTGIFVGAGREMWTGSHYVVVGTWHKIGNGIEFCWLSVPGPFRIPGIGLSPASAICLCKGVLLKDWQAYRNQCVLLSSLKSPLAILHPLLICLVNLFLIDHAKINFEPFAL